MKDGSEVSNIGDPAYTDLIVCDRQHFSWMDPITRLHCTECGTPYDGVAVEIRGGVIKRAWIFTPGELGDTEAGILLVTDSGTLEPKPEWDNHLMDNVAPCWSRGGFWREIW